MKFYEPKPGDTVLLSCPHCERIARPSGESACPDDACQGKLRQEQAFQRLADRPDSGVDFSGFARAVVERSDDDETLAGEVALTAETWMNALRRAVEERAVDADVFASPVGEGAIVELAAHGRRLTIRIDSAGEPQSWAVATTTGRAAFGSMTDFDLGHALDTFSA